MTFSKLSPKQKQVFRWCYKGEHSAIICDGAVRSGKTICMIASFILWAMRKFDGAVFGICGKTVRSAERNIIVPLQEIVDITAYFTLNYTRSTNLLTVQGGGKRNSFYVFGGKDESSYMLIQGITLSGVLFDEVALMPRSFVEQAITRTLSVQGALLWFNCNPGNQFHWFYREWILKSEERAALHLHFLMEDNPTMSPEQLEHARRQFTGVFHDRYIKGLWRSAEGVIYPEFADNAAPWLMTKPPKDIIFCNIGWDFGGNNSAHAGVLTGFSRGLRRMVVLDEYYRREIISPAQLEADFIAFYKRCKAKYPVYDAYLDSAEQVLIKGIRAACERERLPVRIHNARKSEIIGRIRFTNLMLSKRMLSIHPDCTHLIEAMQSAVWDMTRQDDVRLDDGNYNIDSLDAFEYSFEPQMGDILELGGMKEA